jgi:hypothetical protein
MGGAYSLPVASENARMHFKVKGGHVIIQREAGFTDCCDVQLERKSEARVVGELRSLKSSGRPSVILSAATDR